MVVIQINYRDKRPIYEQLVSRIEELLMAGYFLPGAQLPSVRQLACDLSINPNTIQRAYAELERRGLIYSIKGRGSFISEDCEQLLENRRRILETEFDEMVKKMLSEGFSAKQLTERIGAAAE